MERNIDWSVEHALLTADQARRIAERKSGNDDLRIRALDTLAPVYTIGGSHRAASQIDRDLTALRPDLKSSLRRQIYADLENDRPDEAMKKT